MQHLITYEGAGTRIISKSDWASLDIDLPTMTWQAGLGGHNPSLVVEDLPQTALDYLKNVDSTGFKVTEVKKPEQVLDAADENNAAKAEAPMTSTPGGETPTGTTPTVGRRR